MITAQQVQTTAQQDQITALSARVSDLHLMREGTATTATKQCAGAAESPLQQIRSALQTMAVHQIQQVLVMFVEELGKKLGPRPDGPMPEQAVSPLSLAVLHSKLPQSTWLHEHPCCHCSCQSYGCHQTHQQAYTETGDAESRWQVCPRQRKGGERR
jgi:hypothetical protein